MLALGIHQSFLAFSACQNRLQFHATASMLQLLSNPIRLLKPNSNSAPSGQFLPVAHTCGVDSGSWIVPSAKGGPHCAPWSLQHGHACVSGGTSAAMTGLPALRSESNSGRLNVSSVIAEQDDTGYDVYVKGPSMLVFSGNGARNGLFDLSEVV